MFHINPLEFHGEKDFHPISIRWKCTVAVYSREKKQKINIKCFNAGCVMSSRFPEDSSVQFDPNGNIYIVFSAKISTVTPKPIFI